MTFQLYMTLRTTSGSHGLPRYITLIDSMANSRYVDDVTHDMTRHDSVGTFMLLLVRMSSCSVAGWWISSWCVTASPPHGKVHGVFNGHWFAWCCIHTLLLSCMLVSLSGLSIREHIFHVCLFVHPRTHLCMIIHSRENLFACIVYSSIGEPVFLHVLPLFISSVITPCLFMDLCLQSLITRWHQIHKPPILPWWKIISDAGD